MKLPHYITTFPIRQERPAGALRRGHLAVRHTASRWHRMNGAVIFAEHSPKVRPRLSHIPDRDRRPRLSGKTSPFAHTSPWSVHRFLPKQAPSLGRGAPWCSRGNDPICTYIPVVSAPCGCGYGAVVGGTPWLVWRFLNKQERLQRAPLLFIRFTSYLLPLTSYLLPSLRISIAFRYFSRRLRAYSVISSGAKRERSLLWTRSASLTALATGSVEMART